MREYFCSRFFCLTLVFCVSHDPVQIYLVHGCFCFRGTDVLDLGARVGPSNVHILVNLYDRSAVYLRRSHAFCLENLKIPGMYYSLIKYHFLPSRPNLYLQQFGLNAICNLKYCRSFCRSIKLTSSPYSVM